MIGQAVRRLRAVIAAYPHESVVLVYALLYLLSVIITTPTSATLSNISAFLYLGIGVATIWSQISAGRAATDRRARRGWLLLACASAAIWLSGTAWTAWLAWSGRDFSPLVSAWIGFAHVPFAVSAFLSFPSDPRVSLREKSVRIDAALLLVGGLALSWHFGLRPHSAASGAWSADTIAMAGEWAVLVGECMVTLAGAWAVLRAVDRAARIAIGLVFCGHLVFVLSDFFWTFAEASYVPGHWVDAIFFVAWILRWAGARYAFRRAIRHPMHASMSDSAGRESRRAEVITPLPSAATSSSMVSNVAASTARSGLGPSLFVVFAYSLLLLALALQPARSAVDIAVVAALMTALLLMRQHMALSETRTLARATLEQGERFRSLLATSTDFVLVVESDHRVTYASPSVELVVGPLLGKPLTDVLHENDRNSMRSVLASGAPPDTARSLRSRVRTSAGSWRSVEFRVQDHRTDPLVHGFVVNGRDITEELELEGQLGHARKLATLSDMGGRIAHAFNNALAVLMGHAELVTDQLEANAPAREDVRAIKAAAERGAGITRQLLGFSGRHVIRPESVRPAAVIWELQPTLLRLLPPHIRLVLECDSETSPVMLDRAQFEQVLINLVANARDAMPSGGRLTVGVVQRDDEVLVSVVDEGIGMHEDIRARIFEPFFTTKPPGRGTGLGLAMVASIIKRAGGHVDVVSSEGSGTQFTIHLPVSSVEPVVADANTGNGANATNDEAESATADALSIQPGERRSVVLLVDDDALVRRASRRLLERAGYAVLEAASGAAAIAIASKPETTVDVLLTDLMMPEMSGREVIARFRQLRSTVPIVCITGYAAERDEDASLALEVSEIVAKPFSAEALGRAIATALTSRERQP